MPQELSRPDTDTALWERGVTQLSEEFSRLSESHRGELTGLLDEVVRLKGEIVALSDAAEGSTVCAACNGACCRVGRYHPTPLDILAVIAAGERPVLPDFAAGACPFLGEAGCRIAPSRRPRTCVIFVCDLIEERLTGGERVRLVEMEESLKHLYLQAAGLFGRRLTESLILEMERSDRAGVPFLAPAPAGG